MNLRSRSAAISWVDPAGICLSLLCGVHCLAVPFLLTVLPLAGLGFFLEEPAEVLLICSSVLFAGGSLAWGFLIHRQQRAFLTLGVAVVLLATGRSIPEGPYAIAFVVAGAALLTMSHVLNYRLCRACVLCKDETQMEATPLLIQASALSLGYGATTVLRDVHLAVRPGEFWVFLGQNGGGKTTLMKAILGLISPQAGQLWHHPLLASRERTGFVPQRCELNPTLPTTVREFVSLGLVGLPHVKNEREERLSWALSQMGMADCARRSYWALSGGQRQRALVARALVRRPTLLLLDEPTNSLDVATEDALLRLLVAFNQEHGQTVLLVTHNVSLAARHATHVALLHAGRVTAGPKEHILTTHNLAHLYAGSLDLAVLQFGEHPSLSHAKGAEE